MFQASFAILLFCACAFVTPPTVNGQAPYTQPNATESDCICKYGDPICYCTLRVEHRLTMILDKEKKLVYPENGILKTSDGSGGSRSLTEEEISRVITADGETSRLVIAINGKFPGPRIEAFDGQTLEVTIINTFHTDSISVHFHGIHQTGSPWMDGVAFVTQCPVQPGQTFVHRFKAFPPGTMMYHAHIGDQRSMGLYGPMIVRTDPSIRRNDEIVVTLQDWNHLMDAETAYHRMITEQFDLDTREVIKTTSSIDGAQFSRFEFQSGLVNGKARFWKTSTTHNGAPLERFKVRSGTVYYFRIIGAMTLYPMRVYIEGQRLELKASDGFDVELTAVESIIVHPGERYDFRWQADGSKKEWFLVAETLETTASLGGKYHVAEAVIEVVNNAAAPTVNPVNQKVESCTTSDKCITFNCPFGNYGSPTRECLNFNDVKNNDPIRDPKLILGDKVDAEYFFNFAFPGFPGNTPGSVNGREFMFPTSSLLTQPNTLTTSCDETACTKTGTCACTYIQDLPSNQLIQMVFMNIGNGSGWSHPVHLHGHSFYVMKMGLGKYDSSTGRLLNETEDIRCTDQNNFCSTAGWTNDTWSGGGLPGLSDDPPEKDTIVVPTAGYVVIRFVSNNPGLWFLHCHIDLHNTNGMGMLIREGTPPAPPTGFPTCGNFRYDGSGGPISGTSPTHHLPGSTVLFMLYVAMKMLSRLCSSLYQHL